MSRWPAGFAAASFIFALLTCSYYLGPAAREGLGASLLFLLVFLPAAGFGRVLLELFRLRETDGLEGAVIGASLGLGVLSLSIFSVGALGLLRPEVVVVFLGLLWLAGLPGLKMMRAGLKSGGLHAGGHAVSAAGILTVLGVLFWTTWVPAHQYDSLVYHLALPESYVRAGKIVASDHLLFSHFPQNGEMLFTLALLLKSELLAQMFVWACSAVSVGWILTAAGRGVSLPAVLLGCWLLVTHTAVMLVSGTTYVEPVVMLWVTASVFSFLRWHEAPEGQAGRYGRLALSAVFCGLALGTKYYAGITAGLLGAFLFLRIISAGSNGRKERLLEAVFFCATTTVVFYPWLVKNIMMVGNPVFPFLYQYFPGKGTGWEGAAAAGYFAVLTEYGHSGGSLEALIKLPFMLLGNSLRFGGGMDILGNFGWELSFWLLPLSFLAAKSSRFLKGLLVFFVFYMGVWFFTGVVLRFLSATAPVLCLLAGAGFYSVWLRSGKTGRIGLGLSVGLLTALHLFLFGYIHGVFGSGAVLFGLEDREAFLAKRLDYYPCARWSAESLGKNDKILLVGEQRSYYVGQNHLAATVNAPNRYMTWAAQSSSPAAFAERLKAEGFSHVMTVPREARRLAPALLPVSSTAQANISGLNLPVVYEGPACRVYSLRFPEGA